MLDGFVEGVYHEEKVLTGGLREQIRYWAKVDGEEIVLEFLRLDGRSTGMEADRITPEQFQKRFNKTPGEVKEPEKTPEEKEREKRIRLGEIHLEKKELHSAEYEFGSALKIDEKDVRANFGLGKTYVAQGRKEEAKEVFSKLGDNEELYTEENKHTFNELGITLRKEQMYDEAVKSYQKAIKMDAEDPVLYFNLGRALYHLGQIDEAKGALEKALRLNPGFEDAQKMMKLASRDIS